VSAENDQQGYAAIDRVAGFVTSDPSAGELGRDGNELPTMTEGPSAGGTCLTSRHPFAELVGWRARVMNWRQDFDALIESSMAFAKDVRWQPIPDPPIAMKIAEQALAETPNPVEPPATIVPIVRTTPERDEIQKRVNNFRVHQQKIAREREDYYLQIKARMMTPTAFISPKKSPPR
jgi:hypothetical protein